MSRSNSKHSSNYAKLTKITIVVEVVEFDMS